MADQAQMGSGASGLQVVDAGYLNHVEGAKVTRGLEGHVKRLLKLKKLDCE